MAITTTGIAFTISSLGLAFCGLRFFRAFQNMGGLRSGQRIGFLLSTLFFGFSLQHGILAIGGLFFSQIPEALYAILVVDHIVLIFVTALAVYSAFYILLPKISPWPATIAISLFSVFVNWLTINEHFSPFVTVTNSIDWNMPHRLKFLWYIILLVGIGALFLVFVKNFFLAQSRNVKNISFLLMAIHFAGMVNVSIIFSDFLTGVREIRSKMFDIILAIIGIAFIIGFLFVPFVAGWVSRKPQNVGNDIR